MNYQNFKSEYVPLISPEIRDSNSVFSFPKRSPTHNNKSKGPYLVLILFTPAKSSESFPFADPTVNLRKKRKVGSEKNNNNSVECSFYLHFDCGHNGMNSINLETKGQTNI